MGTFEEFNLRWNGFEANTRVAWKELREEKVFQDVTLVAGDGRQVQANKVALAAGSIFFHKIITENPHPHPLIYLKGVRFTHLLSVLDFLYTGEATIDEANLNQFMDVAEDLKMKGLLPTALQTNSHPSSTTSQSQGTTEDPGHSPRVSSSRTPASQVKVDIKENATSASISCHDSVISAPLRDKSVAEEAAISPGISRPHNVISSPLQNLLVKEEFAPLPRVSRPPSLIASERDNTLPQVIREEGKDNISNVKVEVSDAEQDNVFYGMKDGEPFIKHVSVKSFHGNKQNISFKRNLTEQCEKYQNDGMGLSGKQEQDGHIFSKKPKIEIMNIDQIHDWYERSDDNNTMISDGKEDDYFDKEELKDYNVAVTAAADSVFINEQSTHELGECTTENEVNLVPDGEPYLYREKCSFCTKTFAESSELEKHKMSHTSENPLQCPVCNKVFSSRSNLNFHKQIHAEKQFQCLVCFKRFTQKVNLKTHNRIHTEKPYQCLVCFKRFADGSHLNKHHRIHTGEKP